jgi:hypothetical protein
MASLILRQRWIFQHLCNLTPQARWRRRQERAASHWSGAAAAAINGPLGWLIAEIVVALHKRGRSLEGSRLATLRQDALPEALPMLIADIIQSIDWEKPENAPLDRALQDLERFAGIPTDLVWTEMLSDATHYPAGAFVEADA